MKNSKNKPYETPPPDPVMDLVEENLDAAYIIQLESLLLNESYIGLDFEDRMNYFQVIKTKRMLAKRKIWENQQKIEE
jgi:hypothetical protein